MSSTYMSIGNEIQKSSRDDENVALGIWYKQTCGLHMLGVISISIDGMILLLKL